MAEAAKGQGDEQKVSLEPGKEKELEVAVPEEGDFEVEKIEQKVTPVSPETAGPVAAVPTPGKAVPTEQKDAKPAEEEKKPEEGEAPKEKEAEGKPEYQPPAGKLQKMAPKPGAPGEGAERPAGEGPAGLRPAKGAGGPAAEPGKAAAAGKKDKLGKLPKPGGVGQPGGPIPPGKPGAPGMEPSAPGQAGAAEKPGAPGKPGEAAAKPGEAKPIKPPTAGQPKPGAPGAPAAGAGAGAAGAGPKIGGPAAQAREAGEKAKAAAAKAGLSKKEQERVEMMIDLTIVGANIVFLIVELLAIETVVAIFIFIANFVLFLWYLLKNFKRLKKAIVFIAAPIFFLVVFAMMAVPIGIMIILGLVDISGGARASVENIIAPVTAVEERVAAAETQAAQNAYEKAVLAGKDPERATIDAFANASGTPDEQAAKVVAAVIKAEEAKRAVQGQELTPTEREQIIQRTINVAGAVGLAIDTQTVRSILAKQQAAGRNQLLRSPENSLLDFSDSNTLLLPQGNLAGLKVSDDPQGRRIIEISDGAQLVYYLEAPVTGKGTVSLLYATAELPEVVDVGALEIDDQQRRLVAAASTNKQLLQSQFDLVAGKNKLIISSDPGSPPIRVEGIVLEPMTEATQVALATSVLAVSKLETTAVPFDRSLFPDAAELMLAINTTAEGDKFFVLTDATNIPSATGDYALEFRWADEAKWQPWTDFADRTRYFPISFSVQKIYTFYGNLFSPEDAIYFLSVYGSEGGHERRGYFRLKAISFSGVLKLSNEIEFSLVPK